MSVFVVGINHQTASITLREKAYFALDKLSLYLQDLLHHGLAQEALLLSTCNRSELICETDKVQLVRDWFCAQTLCTHEELEPALYLYRNELAIAHLMEVACGLDSMVLGESQILGQMKEAFSESCAAGTIGPSFHRLFQQVFAVAKEIRTTTAIGACPVSVASAAIQFAKQYIIDFPLARVVLLGAGDTSELLMRYLVTQLQHPPIVINRHQEKALLFKKRWGTQVYGFEALTDILITADLVFSATGSPTPILRKDTMMQVMRQRQRPIILIDIAVPRDIESSIAALDQVNLYSIDDLKVIIEKNRHGREHAANKARELIQQKSTDLMAVLHSFDKVACTIRTYRKQIEALCQIELMKAKQQLQQGHDPSQVLDDFAYAFTKKLLHAPSVQLRQAGVEGRFDFLRFANQLFDIPEVAEMEAEAR